MVKRRRICMHSRGLRIATLAVTVLFLGQLFLGVRAEQPLLNHEAVRQLLGASGLKTSPEDVVEPLYVDLTGDGLAELLIGVNHMDTRKGEFLIYRYSGGKYLKAFAREWGNAYVGVTFDHLALQQSQESVITIVKYSPAFGTGWLPIHEEMILWDGKDFRGVWDGLVELVDAGTTTPQIRDSTLSYGRDDAGKVTLELFTITRALENGMPGPVVSSQSRSYLWNSQQFRFVESK